MIKKEAPQQSRTDAYEFVRALENVGNLSAGRVRYGKGRIRKYFDIASQYMFEREPGAEKPRAVYDSKKDRLRKTISFYELARRAAKVQRNFDVTEMSEIGIQRARDKKELMSAKGRGRGDGKKEGTTVWKWRKNYWRSLSRRRK